MKTPEEIKKGLEYLSITDTVKKLDMWKEGIVYDYSEDAAADALAYIQQLERERDAAVGILYGECSACKQAAFGEPDRVKDVCQRCIHNEDAWSGYDLDDNWEWRGVQEGT